MLCLKHGWGCRRRPRVSCAACGACNVHPPPPPRHLASLVSPFGCRGLRRTASGFPMSSPPSRSGPQATPGTRPSVRHAQLHAPWLDCRALRVPRLAHPHPPPLSECWPGRGHVQRSHTCVCVRLHPHRNACSHLPRGHHGAAKVLHPLQQGRVPSRRPRAARGHFVPILLPRCQLDQ